MWIQLTLTVDKSRAALVELLLESLGAEAVTLQDAADEPMLEPAPGEMPLWRDTQVTGLFDARHDSDQLRTAINSALSEDVSRYLRIEPLEEREWTRVWLEHFRPMPFGRRLWIRPGDQAINQDDAVIVDLDPGLAFGTGTHATTALCLRWLDEQDLAGCRVIDFGCGSGILAIAALKLGAEHAVGIDHDTQALEASRANAERNGVSGRLALCRQAEPRKNTPVDLVVANILANTLIDLAPLVVEQVRQGGRVGLSGILKQQEDAVHEAYRDLVDFEPSRSQGDWILMSGKRKP